LITAKLVRVLWHSAYSSKIIGYFLEVLQFNRLFLKLNRCIYYKRLVLPVHCYPTQNLTPYISNALLYIVYQFGVCKENPNV
jgi:hypothetical protein